MDHQRRYLYVLLVLCSLLSCFAASTPQNACGGNAALSNQPMSWCDPGEYASFSPDCRMGVFHCAGPDTVICMPIECPESNRYRSSFLASSSLPDPVNEKSCPMGCGERGRCLEGVCVCDKGWGGERCERFEDPCSSPLAKCGDHGRCVNSNDERFRCECEQGWTGPQCNVPTACLPNGVWISSARRCSCFEGWEGPTCSTCNPDFLCVPTKDRDRPFTLSFVPSSQQKAFLADESPSSSYVARHPIKPNSEYEGVLYDCACRAVSANKENDDDIQEPFLYYNGDTGSFYLQHDPYLPVGLHNPYSSRYTHDYYDRNYYDPNSAALAAALMVGMFLLWLFWWLFAARKPSPPPHIPKNKEAPIYHPLPPPPPPPVKRIVYESDDDEDDETEKDEFHISIDPPPSPPPQPQSSSVPAILLYQL